MKTKIPKPTFEECLPIIDAEIAKNKGKWKLESLSWIDYFDVSQILRIHIFKKFDLYDPSRPLIPWLHQVIRNHISNLVRNNYQNFARPCLNCDAQIDTDGCKIYSKQCSACPMYAEWEKKKQYAYNIKLPVSIENHTNEVQEQPSNQEINLTKHIKNAHDVMKKHLKHQEWLVYQKLFIQHKDEATVIKELNYVGSGRSKQLFNIKVAIMNKFKTLLAKGIIDIY